MLCWWNMFRTNVDTGMSWDQTPRAVRILLVHQHCGGVFQAVCPWTLCWAAVWRGVETSWRCSQRAQPSAPSPTSATLFWTPLELLDGSEPEWHYWHLGYSWDGWITGRLNLIYFVYRWGPNTGEDAFYEEQPIVFIFWHAMTDMNTFHRKSNWGSYIVTVFMDGVHQNILILKCVWLKWVNCWNNYVCLFYTLACETLTF